MSSACPDVLGYVRKVRPDEVPPGKPGAWTVRMIREIRIAEQREGVGVIARRKKIHGERCASLIMHREPRKHYEIQLVITSFLADQRLNGPHFDTVWI